ncbi:MAG: hypothetical protein ACYCWE_15505 [Eubacteriales bacterium]
MKKYILLIIIFALLLFTGCSPIEDTNGEADKSLVTITEEKLKTISGSVSTFNSQKTGSPSRQHYKDSGGISDEEYDYDNIEFSFNRLNGTQKAMITYLKKGQQVKVEFSSEISKGNFGAVILSPDKAHILERFLPDEEKTIHITAEADGDYLLVIAGESCEGNLKIKRTVQ